MYIHILNLLWIIPCSVILGMWAVSLFSANREIDEYKIEMTEDEIDKWTL